MTLVLFLLTYLGVAMGDFPRLALIDWHLITLFCGLFVVVNALILFAWIRLRLPG